MHYTDFKATLKLESVHYTIQGTTFNVPYWFKVTRPEIMWNTTIPAYYKGVGCTRVHVYNDCHISSPLMQEYTCASKQ